MTQEEIKIRAEETTGLKLIVKACKNVNQIAIHTQYGDSFWNDRQALEKQGFFVMSGCLAVVSL